MDLAGYKPTLSEVAALFGKSSRWISDLRAKGDLPGDGATLAEFVAAWTSANAVAGKGKTIDQHKARLAAEKADEAAMRNAERRRELLPRVEVALAVPNTWTARAYPDGEKHSINPAGVVYSRAPEIMDAFTRGATIRPVAGSQFLWIPTRNVPRARARSTMGVRGLDGQIRQRRYRGGSISPEECESRFNTDFVMRKGRAGRLLAYMDLLAGRARRGGSAFRPVTARRQAQGRVAKLTLMFVLTRSVTMPKLFDLDASAGRWAVRYEQALDRRLAQS